MSLLWADDFSTYGVGGQAYMLNGVYAEMLGSGLNTITLAADPDPNSAGNPVVRTYNNYTGGGYGADPHVRKVFASAKTTIGGSIRMWMTQLPAFSNMAPFITFCDSGNLTQVTLIVTTTGAIAAYRGYGVGGTLLGTSTSALTADAWHHLEWKIVASQTVGTIDIYVNGTSILSLTGLDTIAQTEVSYSQMSFGNVTYHTDGEFYTYWRDLILWDASGTVNNDIMGTCYVGRFTVNSDSSFNWTASTGATGYNLIDEAGPSDADYISADATPPAASTFGLENLPADVTSIRGIILLGRLKKSDGGDCTVQMSVVDAGTPTNGADRAITTAYTYWADVLETNTRTAAAFTPTEFNSATFKINRTL